MELRLNRVVLLLTIVFCLHCPTRSEAEEYPTEVREAFLTECATGGAPEGVCRCIFDKMQSSVSMEALQSGDYDEELMVGWAKACVLAEPTGAVALVPRVEPPLAAEGSYWGPDCRAYFAAVENWCNDASAPIAGRELCEVWMPGVDQMKGIEVPNDPDIIAQMDVSCRMTLESFELMRASLEP
ncbi:MAG: hypothetical protein AUK47_28175 [Deltaproteobacteria bacterium CG2_30_63_29]|nr:MAG: hypothetical protein AUK47_28175 [Deltaproteobacteria bacterium CG2_30_63_29]PJB41684.1 MAG: hypothetical protein CO108_12705 [Deltaproteobacteria bacterium CG_4_9_14_3_um_filter_63_12]